MRFLSLRSRPFTQVVVGCAATDLSREAAELLAAVMPPGGRLDAVDGRYHLGSDEPGTLAGWLNDFSRRALLEGGNGRRVASSRG